MQTGHDLFVHGLNDMIDAERQLIRALEELAGDSSRADKALEQYRGEPESKLRQYVRR